MLKILNDGGIVSNAAPRRINTNRVVLDVVNVYGIVDEVTDLKLEDTVLKPAFNSRI